MASLRAAYEFCIVKCNAENVRYSMDDYLREGRIQDGLQYYDCSALMYACLVEGGFYDGVSGYTPWWWTAIEDEELALLGWTKHPASTEWKKGDILWRSGHTEMVYNTNSTMGARSSRVPAANQVEIHESTPDKWTYLFRCPESHDDLNNGGEFPTDWINKNDYLTESEKLNNAKLVYKACIDSGWSESSIFALLGNMDQESNINPGFEQRGSGTGYGLVQWTPGTRWKNWADTNGFPYDSGDGQMLKIFEEMTASGQDEWYTTQEIYGDNPPNGEYNLTREQFLYNELNKSVAYLTSAWLWEYERPNLSDAMEVYRIERALHWQQQLQGYTPNPDPGGFNMPVWLVWKILEVNKNEYPRNIRNNKYI